MAICATRSPASCRSSEDRMPALPRSTTSQSCWRFRCCRSRRVVAFMRVRGGRGAFRVPQALKWRSRTSAPFPELEARQSVIFCHGRAGAPHAETAANGLGPLRNWGAGRGALAEEHPPHREKKALVGLVGAGGSTGGRSGAGHPLTAATRRAAAKSGAGRRLSRGSPRQLCGELAHIDSALAAPQLGTHVTCGGYED